MVLPERKYFKIGEVAELVGVEPHVLRYWETQFSQLRPHKARSGHRLYRRREVETLLVIKDLLHVQRFTIAGARQALRQQGITTLLPTAAENARAVQLSLTPTAAVDVEEVDDDEVADDVDEEVEFHLADSAAARRAHKETLIEIEAKDESDLDDALEAQLAETLARKRGGGAVRQVEVHARARGGRNHEARALLRAAAAELEAALARYDRAPRA